MAVVGEPVVGRTAVFGGYDIVHAPDRRRLAPGRRL